MALKILQHRARTRRIGKNSINHRNSIWSVCVLRFSLGKLKTIFFITIVQLLLILLNKHEVKTFACMCMRVWRYICKVLWATLVYIHYIILKIFVKPFFFFTDYKYLDKVLLRTHIHICTYICVDINVNKYQRISPKKGLKT